jgi:hypothetical protein
MHVVVGANELRPIAISFCNATLEAKMSQDAATRLERPRAELRVVVRNSTEDQEPRRLERWRPLLRVLATVATVLLLPPFLLLAVAPMLLMLVPVALVAIPFLIPALLTVSIAARSEERQRNSWRPPRAIPRPQRALH